MEFGWRSEVSHAPAGQAVQGGGRPAAESPRIVAECVQEGQRSLAQERPEAASAGHAGPESPPNPPPASQECDSRAPSPAAAGATGDGWAAPQQVIQVATRPVSHVCCTRGEGSMRTETLGHQTCP